ncbi:hypothetical protein McPS_00010 [Marichromatium sp. PS1]
MSDTSSSSLKQEILILSKPIGQGTTKISLAGIARAVKVSEAWLQNYVNEKYKKVPRQVALKKTPHPTE